MKIAVVGAGYAGLAVCWHLLQHKGVAVDLFDSKGIGGGASGVSTGLLHPFPGRLALRSLFSQEGMQASLELIDIAEAALGRTVALRTGILRVAVQPVQVTAFGQRKDSESIWIDNVRQKWPHAIEAPGLWIPGGLTVLSKLYLEGLWKACEKRGAVLQKTHIHSLSELDGYDHTVLAAGHATSRFPECASFDIQLVKGQALLCKTNERFTNSLIGIGHITPTEVEGVCQVGSTYEHGYLDEEPHQEVIQELLLKTTRFYPPAANFETIEVRAGIRIAPKQGYLPIALQIAPHKWAFTALGSRGLLYHALFGKKIAEQILVS